ncbi:MAG: 4Fe-4S binding protein [Nitrospirae bacterium]|nr:4Fe-4S binding protein [Nitrospirota bacterium]
MSIGSQDIEYIIPPQPPLVKGGKSDTPPLSKGGLRGGVSESRKGEVTSPLPNPSPVTRHSSLKISRLRRFVLLIIIALFLLQFLRIKILVGGLTGSLAVWLVKLLDVFAYLETLAASRDFTATALWAALPVVGLYLVFGRAFCGWACPMDFLFELVNKTGVGGQGSGVGDSPLSRGVRGVFPPFLNSNNFGYIIAGSFIILSAILGVPLFTRYLSHLTNFFTAITSAVYISLDLPADPMVLLFSGTVIFSLLILEYFFPRLYCRVLCPVGKIYGLFNKISLLRLKFVEGNCGECNLCEQVCYMKVRITPYMDQPGLRDTNCIYCGRCVEGCETKGKLVKIELKVES